MVTGFIAKHLKHYKLRYLINLYELESINIRHCIVTYLLVIYLMNMFVYVAAETSIKFGCTGM